MKVNLFYLSPNTTGGWVTFTYHLTRALKAVGLTPALYKIRPRTEGKKRPFGYDIFYQNVSLETAVRLLGEGPGLIVAAAKNFKDQTETLIANGAQLVVHDPTELKNLPNNLDQSRCVIIRQAGRAMLPNAWFIRHPYERFGPVNKEKHDLAVSTCRIDFDKNTHILLDANRLTKRQEDKIQIWGFENRLYTRFKICPNYPEWRQSEVAYSRHPTSAFEILSDAKFAVDMSIIKGDGGGTQYSFLEAWDAGAVPIIHAEWIRDDDDMVPGTNCFTAQDGESLRAVLDSYGEDYMAITEHVRQHFVTSGHESLKKHDPAEIGQLYKEFLRC